MTFTTSLSLCFALLLPAVWTHDLLYFDEFEYEFDLNAASDWDHYHLRQHAAAGSGDQENDAYIDALYKNEQTLHQNLGLLRSLNTPQDYASTCTKRIPLLFRQLCVHWRFDQGFKYHFQSPDSMSQFQSAHAENKNNLLDESTVYAGDDRNWNEVNYANTLSAFTLNRAENDGRDYMENYGSGSFKSCRYRTRMRECVAFHLPTQKFKVRLKVGRARKEKNVAQMPDSPSNAHSIDQISSAVSAAAADMQNEYGEYEEYYAEDDDEDAEGAGENENADDDAMMSSYDFHQDFEYGDNMGYAEWAANAMKWRTFDCLNCDERGRRLRAAGEDEKGMFDTYGDYTYMYNEYEMHFDDDYDWNEIARDGLMKCTTVIPGLEHKLCVDTANKQHKGAKITFAAAQQQSDIDDGYYDMYGYDMYYYNVDQLAKQKHESMQKAREGYADWYYEDSDREQDTKTQKQNKGDDDDDGVDDGDDGSNYEDYYHTHSDKHMSDDDDGDANGDADADNGDSDSDLDDERNAFEAGFEGHEVHQRHNNDADPMAKYPDAYKKIKELEDEQEDEQEDDQEMQQYKMNSNSNPMMGGNGYARRRMLGSGSRLLIEDDDDGDEEEVGDEEDEFDHLFGDDEFDEYYDAAQTIYDEMHAAFSNMLRNELSEQEIHFLDDDAWDDITTVYDDHHRRHSIRKCVALQSSHLCATHSLVDPQKAPVFHLKIGRHKFHRSANGDAMSSSDAAAAMNVDDGDDEQKFSTNDEAENSGYQHWYVDDDVFAIDDAQWNDAALWTSSLSGLIKTNALQQQIHRKCQADAEFCLCEYMDALFDHHRKHVCYNHGHPPSHARPTHATHNQRIIHAMDDFFTHHLHNLRPVQHKSPLRITYRVPHYHSIPTIHHYHIIGGYPSFHRSTHQHPRLMIPWNAFREHANEIPQTRPEWMPPWMYREVMVHSGKPEHRLHGPGHQSNKKTLARLEKDEQQIVKEIEKHGSKSENGGGMAKFNVDARVQQILQELGGEKPSKTKKKSSAYAMDSGNAYEHAEEEGDETDTQDMMRFMFPIMQQNMMHMVAVVDGIQNMVGHGQAVDMQGAEQETKDDAYARAMAEAYDMYGDEEDEGEDEGGDEDEVAALDTFEVDGAQWTMERDAFELLESDSDALREFPLDEIDAGIIGSSGVPIQKRCTVLFGSKVCLCQFLHLLKVRETEHLCYPHAHQPHDILLHSPRHLKFPNYHDRLMDADPHKKAWMMSEANKINHLVRSDLPHARPLWVPHVFWHWLHHAPHFHLYRHKHRVANEHLWMPHTFSAQSIADDKNDILYEEYDADVGYDDDEYDGDAYIAYDNDGDAYDDNDGDDDDDDDADAYEFMHALDSGGVESQPWLEAKHVSERMWSVQLTFVCVLIASLTCVMISCFIWKSKWGRLVRQLHSNRVERNKRLHDMKMKARIDILSNEDGSSSVASIH